MVEQLKRHGWVYILQDPADQAIADDIGSGLNRLGHPVWNRARDAADLDDLRAHSHGIERAAVVVLLESAALRGNDFASRLCDWARKKGRTRPGFVCVSLAGDCDDESWCSDYCAVRVPLQPLLRETIHQVHRRIELLRARRPYALPATAPEGPRGRYGFLSYASEDDARVTELSKQLLQMGITTWDYAVAARNARAGHYREELAQSIRHARFLLIVLTSAWLKSTDCLQEAVSARKSDRRCVWLRCEPVSPPDLQVSDVLVDLCNAVAEQESLELLWTQLRSARLGMKVGNPFECSRRGEGS